MLKKILLGVVLIVAVFCVVVALQPSEYHVERTTTMAAPPALVFAQVNDFHNWEEWSPWVKIDPKAKVTFEGPTAGQGAIFRWAGNSDVGEGSMTILESHPDDLVKYQLDFIKPFAGTATSQFKIAPKGDQSEVTWSMDGRSNFLGKAVCLFMNMDKMVGGKYEEGLAAMKGVVEKKK